jgi:hypothetical protein
MKSVNQLRAKNHFVPQCYLKQWADAKQNVQEYQILVSHEDVPIWRLRSPSATGYQEHFYTQILDGKESDDFEKWLAEEFEEPAAPVINKVINDNQLTPADWEMLIKFLAAQDLRTPFRFLEHYQSFQEMMPKVLEEVLSDVKEKLERDDVEVDKDISELLDNPVEFPLRVTTHIEEGEETGIVKAESYVGRALWLHSTRHLLTRTRKVLHDHRWTIIKPAKGYSWFTSDNPVIKLNYNNDYEYDFGGGWGKVKGNIIFPLSPEHAMFVQIGDRPKPKGARLTVEQTIRIRRFIAENAHRKIYSNFPDEDIPVIRPRTINAEQYNAEKMELSDWHRNNAEMEMRYLASNRK